VQFLSADVYFINYLPSELEWSDVKMIVSCAFIMTVAATIYPAWRASKVEPAEALRYE
ncbi:MAG: lipoprotein-releasing system transmembrane subunit LolC, partial [Marinomonas sp.]